MLQHLSIQNYALIESMELDLKDGFTVITGETGAGKSIILGALGLILGERADVKVCLNPDRKCVVEAFFSLDDIDLSERTDTSLWMDGSGADTTLIMRREILPGGKSRAFINDTPVGLASMREVGNCLVDIHSQHKTLFLEKSDFQRELLDSYAQNASVLKEYREVYDRYRKIRARIREGEERLEARLKEEDFLKYQCEELEQAQLTEGEQQEMEDRLQTLEHSEQIQQALLYAQELLESGEGGMVSSLSSMIRQLSKVQPFFPELEEVNRRFSSLHIELKDLSRELEHLNGSLDLDPGLKTRYEERLDLLYKLETKHKVSTDAELLELLASYRQQLQGLSTLEVDLEHLKKELQETEKRLEQQAVRLYENRMAAVPSLEKSILESLRDLSMGDARFEIRVTPLDTYQNNGREEVKFFFNANQGGELREIGKVASGGELSRLMLAIKSVIHQRSLMPCLIFDEIDTGVSGEIASKVGNQMVQMSRYMQLICITHLPQIAAKADTHLRVTKALSSSHQTMSRIQTLDHTRHLQTIAAMLGNGTLSESALKMAQELVEDGKLK